jgi:hypothetical protein
MPKKQRTYWIQLCYAEGREDEWLESFSGYNDTCVTAGALLLKRNADRALILRPWVRPEAMAADRDILADLDREPRPDTKTLTIQF